MFPNSSFSDDQWYYIIGTTIVGGVCIILSGLSIFRSIQRKDNIYFVKRRYKIICTQNILCCAWLISVFGFYYSVVGVMDDKFYYYSYVILIIPGVYFGGNGAALITSLRLWLYYYDLELNKFNRNKEWRRIIDPKNDKLSNISNNWFVKNQQKYYYNTSYYIKIIFIIAFLQTVIILLGDIYDIVGYLINAFMTILHGGLFIYLIFGKIAKTEKYGQDNLGFKCEGYLLSSFVLFSFVISLVRAILVSTIKNINQMYMLSLFFSISLVNMTYCVCSINIFGYYYYENYRLKNKNINCNITICKFSKNGYDKNYTIASKSNYNELSLAMVKNDFINQQKLKNFEDVSWLSLISFYDGFEAIMNHLEKEFSMENLLFIQEV